MASKKLQKIDLDTNAMINAVQQYLVSTHKLKTVTRDMAWQIFQTIHKLPYHVLISRNPEIEYQGQGRHLSHKHENQLLVIKDLGRFELQGVSSKKDLAKSARIKFTPSKDIDRLLENVKVVGEGE